MPLFDGIDLLKRLKNGEQFLSDGGIGSLLIDQGITQTATLLANLHYPSKVTEIHRRYIEAGSRIISSNTFGSVVVPFAPNNGGVAVGCPPAMWREAFEAGVNLALYEAEKSKFEMHVMISLSGFDAVQILESLDESLLRKIRAHFILIETCISISEAVRAVEIAHQLNLNLIAVTCHFMPDGRMTDGTPLEELVSILEYSGVKLIGANCGDEPEQFFNLAQTLQAKSNIQIIMQPSAGLPLRDKIGRLTYPVSPRRFADACDSLVQSGVNIVGGCCGTTPAHIEALRNTSFGLY